MAEEQRKYLRIPARNRVFIELESGGPEGTSSPRVAECQSLDVSRTGMRVQVDQQLTTGSILHIGAELPEREDTLYLAGEVIWCRPNPDVEHSWLAGFRLMNAAQSDIDHWYTLWAIREA